MFVWDSAVVHQHRETAPALCTSASTAVVASSRLRSGEFGEVGCPAL
jgi:hypothetical protein